MTREPGAALATMTMAVAAGVGCAVAVAREPGGPTGLLFEPPVFINQGEWGTGSP